MASTSLVFSTRNRTSAGRADRIGGQPDRHLPSATSNHYAESGQSLTLSSDLIGDRTRRVFSTLGLPKLYQRSLPMLTRLLWNASVSTRGYMSTNTLLDRIRQRDELKWASSPPC